MKKKFTKYPGNKVYATTSEPVDYLSWKKQNARKIADELLNGFLTSGDGYIEEFFSDEDREKMMEVYDMLYDFSKWED